MNVIDYDKLHSNISTMINLLEYDAMRSPGKAKMNSQHLHSMYELLDRYTAKLKSKPGPKPVAQKEG